MKTTKSLEKIQSIEGFRIGYFNEWAPGRDFAKMISRLADEWIYEMMQPLKKTQREDSASS